MPFAVLSKPNFGWAPNLAIGDVTLSTRSPLTSQTYAQLSNVQFDVSVILLLTRTKKSTPVCQVEGKVFHVFTTSFTRFIGILL